METEAAPSRSEVERWKFLAEASMVVQDTLDYHATLERVVSLAVPTLADWVGIALRADDGTLSWAASAHADPECAELTRRLRKYPPRGAAGVHPVLMELHSGTTQLVRHMPEEMILAVAHDDEHLALMRELDCISYMSTPMVARERVFGSLVLVSTRRSGRTFGPADVAIARETARRAALAVDHAMLYTAAEQAARSREAVLAMVSHDLKNPLSTIMMASSFMLDDLVPDDSDHRAVRAHLRAVGRAATGMRRLVGDLLDVSAIEAGRLHVAPAELCVREVMEEAAEHLLPLAAAKRIRMVVDTPPEPLSIHADRDRILQVLSNLGGNAVKFTPEGGRVTLAAAPDDGVVVFRVSDTGAGIAPDDLPHVFERFWQARETATLGTGLGLAITRGLVEAHGGQITAESAPGAGSTFRFTIRVCGQAREPA